MYSLNSPIPGRVARIASELRPVLSAFESVRERHSLLVKRLGRGNLNRTVARAREVLAGTSPVGARVTGIDVFRDPPRGPGPVVYLAVESSGLRDIHAALLREFGAIERLEGDEYVPHVTLARGGSPLAATEELLARAVDTVEWTITELEVYDARRKSVQRRISLSG